MAARIRKDDDVIVIAGRDKGRRGRVLKILSEKGRALVSGVQLIKRHTKPTNSNAGGIVSKEASIHLSNLALLDPRSGSGTRVGFKFDDKGRKVRFSKRSGDVLDD